MEKIYIVKEECQKDIEKRKYNRNFYKGFKKGNREKCQEVEISQ